MADLAHKVSSPKTLEARPHPPLPDDRPYYDPELKVPHSPAHMAMITDLASIFRALSEEVGWPVLSDNAIWFLEPQDDEQRISFPDLVLLKPQTDIARVTAASAQLVGEVVTTTERRKEVKDTRYQLALCEYNEVPELALFFPEIDDPRALSYHRFVDGRYEALVISPGTSVRSESVPQLEFQVLPRDAWRPGRKVDVVYNGELRLPVAGERQRAEAERQRAEAERQRAETERQRAETERQRAEAERQRADGLGASLQASEQKRAALEARLRELGIEPSEL